MIDESTMYSLIDPYIVDVTPFTEPMDEYRVWVKEIHKNKDSLWSKGL